MSATQIRSHCCTKAKRDLEPAPCQDKREGSGSYFYAESGKVFVGEWANDLPKAGDL